ncbi:hypothetical protein PGTUg99_018730 [Puccinia graminis f. sp. tritici]|uniref:Uncharacterized protein n=1 Tax=Puccinia graminis f. sp. tritici TaxID=56615 RepID=A0A5B0R8P2_PUCGR|nr:hypothetical protein PGTUg99_018730 [Puccinia graminis f. sp. tritici]
MNSGPTGKLRSAKPVEACGPPTAQRPMTCHSPKSAQVDGQSIRLWRLNSGSSCQQMGRNYPGLASRLSTTGELVQVPPRRAQSLHRSARPVCRPSV